MQLATVFTKRRMRLLITVIKKIKMIYFQTFVNLSFEKFKNFFQNWLQTYFISDSNNV